MHIVKPLTGGGRFYTYPIQNSCLFDNTSSQYMEMTPLATGNLNTFTISTWLKRGKLGVEQGIAHCRNSNTDNDSLILDASDRLRWRHLTAGATADDMVTTMVLRDPATFYNIILAIDTTQATESDRLKMYVNGNQVTDFDTTNYPALNGNMEFGLTQAIYWGREMTASVWYYLDGYLSNCIYVNGAQLTPDNFGMFKDGVWIPKDYTGTYGTGGHFLDFADSADLGKDVSGNGNDFTTSGGMDATNQVIDSPTNNFTTLNPLNFYGTGVLSAGNLNIQNSTSLWKTAASTIALESGKWFYCTGALPSVAYAMLGCADEARNWVGANIYPGQHVDSYGFEYLPSAADCNHRTNNSVVTCTGYPLIAGDYMLVAFDADDGKLWFGRHRSGSTIWFDATGGVTGNPETGANPCYSGITKPMVPALASYTQTAPTTINFGQRAFPTGAQPTGFKSICSENLPTPTIINGRRGAGLLTWDGDDTTPRSIQGLQFSPDFAWIKGRVSANGHVWYDTVRGVGVNKALFPHAFNAEGTGGESTNGGYVSAMLADGIQVASGSTDNLFVNDTGQKYVGLCLKDHSKYGINMVSYVGDGAASHAVSHGLGGVPELMIFKTRDSSVSWLVYHHHVLTKTDPETDFGYLNGPDAWADAVSAWNDTAPTATQFTVGNGGAVNASGDNYIAYLFRSIPGFSKVFSFEGTGNADGPFIHMGFRPRFIMLKNADAVANWLMNDTARDLYNPIRTFSIPNLSNAEADTIAFDVLANGIKLRTTNASYNASGQTIIGIAFADNPFKYANAF